MADTRKDSIIRILEEEANQNKIQTIKKLEQGQSSSSTTASVFLNALQELQQPLQQIRTPQLQMVPASMRRNIDNDGCYDPSQVSIGPYHHGKIELAAAECLKPLIALRFVSESGGHYMEFYNKVFEVRDFARSFYLDGSTAAYDDMAFTNMMFLNGCFILYYANFIIESNEETSSFLVDQFGYGNLSTLYSDFFLLENQLSFAILQVLIGVKYSHDGGEQIMNDFVDIHLVVTLKRKILWHGKPFAPIHILELMRAKLLGIDDQLEDSVPVLASSPSPSRARQYSILSQFLQKICCHCKGGEGAALESVLGGSVAANLFHFFRSASELKVKGIEFGPCVFPLEISFTSGCFSGHLTLPCMVISAMSKKLYLNMIASEKAPHTLTEREISTYIYLMDCLIDGADDVKELRSSKIIYSHIDSDEDLAKILNDIGKEVTPNFEIIKEVTKQIQEHYDSKLKTWLAQVMHDHFSSPWTITAFLAAVFVIALTVVQTYFAIFPRDK